MVGTINPMIMKAMIFAAGFGTRLKPFTLNHPKALLKVNQQTLLEKVVRYLQKFNIYSVIVNVHHFPEQIIKEINDNNGWGSDITISQEPEILETGGGLLFAKKYFQNEKDFIIINTDILTTMPLTEMIEHHVKNQHFVTLSVSNRVSTRYLLFNEENVLCGWKNIKTNEIKIIRPYLKLSEFAFNGIQIMNYRFFEALTLTNHFSIIDAFLQVGKLNNIKYFDASSYFFIDVGKLENIAIAEKYF